VLIARRRVVPGEDGGECGGSAGLDQETKDVPQHVLCANDVRVLDEKDAVDMLLCDRKRQRPNAPRRQRIGRDATGGRVNRSARPQRVGQCGRPDRLDADNARRLVGVPRGDTAD